MALSAMERVWLLRDANDSVVVTDAVYVNMPERGDVNGGEVDNFQVVE